MNEIFLSSSFCYLLNALSPLVYSGKHFRALPSMMEMGWHRAVQHILSNLLCFSSFLFCTFSMRGKKKKKKNYQQSFVTFSIQTGIHHASKHLFHIKINLSFHFHFFYSLSESSELGDVRYLALDFQIKWKMTKMFCIFSI